MNLMGGKMIKQFSNGFYFAVVNDLHNMGGLIITQHDEGIIRKIKQKKFFRVCYNYKKDESFCVKEEFYKDKNKAVKRYDKVLPLVKNSMNSKERNCLKHDLLLINKEGKFIWWLAIFSQVIIVPVEFLFKKICLIITNDLPMMHDHSALELWRNFLFARLERLAYKYDVEPYYLYDCYRERIEEF